MAIENDESLKPAVGVSLRRNGCVVEHGMVVDRMGRWFGLLCLVVEMDGSWPDTQPWEQMLPANATVHMVLRSDTRTGRVGIYYKLAQTLLTTKDTKEHEGEPSGVEHE